MMDPKKMLNENIIGLLGLESLSDEEKTAMVDKMAELVHKRLMLRVVEKLSPQDQQQVAQSNMTENEMLQFVAEKVPEFDEMMREEIVKIKNEMLGLV